MLDRRTTQFPFLHEDLITKFAYNGSNQVEYIGRAQPGSATSEAKWQIKKYTYSSGLVTDIQFADGANDYVHIWDERTGLSYS